MAAPEIRAMTGVRGAAACFVMIYHFCVNLHSDSPWSIALKHGYLSVDLFFILSGFVMAHVYGPAFSDGTFSFREFLWHRFTRIYPLYLLMTLAFAALAIVRMRAIDLSPPVLLSNILMLQSLGNWPSIDPPAWSVSVETVAYLLFPAIALLCLKSRPVIAGVVGFVAIGVIFAMILAASRHLIGASIAEGELDLFFSPYTLFRCLAGFSLGQLVWRVGALPITGRIASRDVVQLVVAVGGVVALTRLHSDFILYLLIIALILCLSTDRGFVSRIFGSGPIHRLGTLSFAIYLFHFIALGTLSKVDGRLVGWGMPATTGLMLAALVVGLAVIAAAWLLHRGVERPTRALLRKSLAGDRQQGLIGVRAPT